MGLAENRERAVEGAAGMKSQKRRNAAAVIAISMVFALIPSGGQSANALGFSDWNAGNIISDALFYDAAAMTEAEIQSFLDSKVSSCGNSQCLRNLRAEVDSRAASYSSNTGNLICRAFEGGNLSAATIIYRAQIACGISAKVILVTLQKEQGLITNPSPSEAATKRAMGMACPDTAPCASYALGFGNQVYLGTKQLMTYKASRFAKQPGTHFVQFNPDSNCGGSTVNVQNYATAALYSYTPYQPNAAALTNLGGVGDHCSSYGNRNFWVFYNSWFGTTQGGAVASVGSAPGLLVRDGEGALHFFQGDGKGNWAEPRQLSPDFADMTHVFGAGDIDGDGHRDILSVDASGVLWRYGMNVDGGLDPRIQVSTDWGDVDVLFSPGDFTGDRWPDLIARTTNGDLWLYPGTGKGLLKPGEKIGWGWSSYSWIGGVGDFNGDGKVDLMGRDGSSNLVLHTGNGRGGWGGSSVVGWNWGGFAQLSSPGDFDGDGRADLVGVTPAGLVYLYRGNGAGSWSGSGLIGNGWTGFNLVEGVGPKSGRVYVEQPGAGDINQDGHRDVLAAAADGGLYVYHGDGAGYLSGSALVATEWAAKTATFGVGDFDGDGAPDVMSRELDGTLLVHRVNERGHVGPGREVGMGWEVMDMIFSAGDVDGDGANDLLAREVNGYLWLYPTDGAGGWLPRKQVGHGWAGFTSIFSVGDFDGDGRADLVARDAFGYLHLYSGNGAGGWLAPRQIGNGWAGFSIVFSPGDITGDQYPDIIARDQNGTLLLYSGNGRGGWLPARGAIGWGWNGMSWIG